MQVYVTFPLESMSTLSCRAVNLFPELRRDGNKGATRGQSPLCRDTSMLNHNNTWFLHGFNVKENRIRRIKQSISAFDTAWMAMVPAEKGQHRKPRFPQCLNWIMENQLPAGWWPPDPFHPLLVSATLACILAIRKWNVREQLVHRGLELIGDNAWAAFDTFQHALLGFNVIFPAMIQNALDMNLNLLFPDSSVHAILNNGEMKILRSDSDEKKASIHPLDAYTRICIVDKLVRLGIDHFFETEIKTILDETYRAWLDGDDEIFSHIPCLAMGFRLLRMNGYDVSSNALSGLDDQDCFFDSTSLQFQNTSTILELYRASHIRIFTNEPTLEKMNKWTTSYLKQALQNGGFEDKILQKEVEYDLKYALANLERLETRKTIELYKQDNTQLLKISSMFLNTEDLLQLSIKNFNMCQSIYIKELESLERWSKGQRIDQLEFARQKVAPCYFAFAATLCFPELVDARCSATKIAVLVTVIDDFFDFAGSEEELLNLIQLVEKWERHSDIEFCSERVEILFSAVYNTTNEYIEKASKEHGWNVKNHFIETWLELLNCMNKEAEWARNKVVPTLDDYMEVGYVSIALGPMTLAPMYFLGCELSEEVVRSSEFKALFKHMMMIGRLLNDLASVDRERAQGKLNSVELRKMRGLTEEEAIKETRREIESHDRELLRMMVETKGSVVPKACKELLWRSGKVLHLFYLDNDGYSSQQEMVGAMNAVIYEPIRFPPYSI